MGHCFVLRTQASNRHAGILDDPKLLRILAQFPLRLNATLLLSESGVKQPTEIKSRNQTSTHSIGNHRVRIAVHGYRTDKKAIGKGLSKANIFLQHPSAAEVLPEVEYDNPHYLLRPGAEMPRIEDLSIDIDNEIPSQTELEDETKSSNLLRIFESAGADGEAAISLKATPSPRLRSTLMM